MIHPGSQQSHTDRSSTLLAAPAAALDPTEPDPAGGYRSLARAILGGGAVAVAAELSSARSAAPGLGTGTLTLLALVLVNVVGFAAAGFYLYARDRGTA